MKKISLFTLFAIIFIMFQNTVWANDENYIRIGLFYGSGARESYDISSKDSSLILGSFDKTEFFEGFDSGLNSLTVTKDIKDGEAAYHIKYEEGLTSFEAEEYAKELIDSGINAYPVLENGSYQVWGDSFSNENDALWAAENLSVFGEVVYPDKDRICYKSGNQIVFISGRDEKSGIYSMDGELSVTAIATKSYRGMMMPLFAEENLITLVNVVEEEEYLYSVISQEMSPSWHIEALKAQAVCARTYARQSRNKHIKYGFDLCSTVCCQAYPGISSETAQSYAPVDETKGEIVTYDGEPCQVFYSSSMGPSTEDVKYVWGSEFPYLTSVENPYEDYENVYGGTWKNTLTKKRATEIMNQKGYDIGDVTDIVATKYSPSDRVIELVVKGTKGEKTFTRESCRLIFSEVTLSQMYTVTGGGEEKIPPYYMVGPVGKVKSEETEKTILTKDGKKTVKGGFFITDGINIKNYAVSYTDNSSFTFSGHGWGHGIGMSQYGAKGMAEAGFDYKEILTHYFTGTEVN